MVYRFTWYRKYLGSHQMHYQTPNHVHDTWLGKNRPRAYLNNLSHHNRIRTTTNHNFQRFGGLEANI